MKQPKHVFKLSEYINWKVLIVIIIIILLIVIIFFSVRPDTKSSPVDIFKKSIKEAVRRTTPPTQNQTQISGSEKKSAAVQMVPSERQLIKTSSQEDEDTIYNTNTYLEDEDREPVYKELDPDGIDQFFTKSTKEELYKQGRGMPSHSSPITNTSSRSSTPYARTSASSCTRSGARNGPGAIPIKFSTNTGVVREYGNNKKPSRGEKILREVLEEIYGVPFPTVRPDFLKNPETGCNLELDCYNDELRIAGEYNGEQHYVFPNYFHGNDIDKFKSLLGRDKFKFKTCRKLDIYLIIVPYTVPLRDIKQFVIKNLPEAAMKGYKNFEQVDEVLMNI
jgi:hypothetical protein